MAEHSCAIDLGTSGVTLALVNIDGHMIASKRVSYRMESPRRGWAEAGPLAWMQAIDAGLEELLTQNERVHCQ